VLKVKGLGNLIIQMFLGARKPKQDPNRIAKICYGHLCMREDNIENPLKMGTRTNNDLQNTTQKTQDRAIKTGVI
jgi:hypothetical protein